MGGSGRRINQWKSSNMFAIPVARVSGRGVRGGSIGVTSRAKFRNNRAEFSGVRDRRTGTAKPHPGGRHPSALGRRSVVLVGMMGAGKSTIGRRLAARLRLPFLDADIEIEAAAGDVDPGNLRNPRRAAFPRRRGAGDRAAARWRPGRDRHRRRRLHARGDPQPHPRQGGLDLAQGGCRHHHEAGQAPCRPAAAADRRSGRDRQPPARRSASRFIATPT